MGRNPVWDFVKKVGRDIDHQFWNRTGPHGAAELGAALSGQGNGYVMYGHSGPPPDEPARDQQAQDKGQDAQDGRDDPEPTQERGGRGR
jgi:hypothetical protein